MCFDGVYCSSDKQIENSLAQQLKQTTWIQGKLELLLVLLIGLVGNSSCWVKSQWLDCSKRQKNIFNRFHRAHYLLCFHGNVIAGHSGHSPAPTVYTSITKQGLRDHTHTQPDSQGHIGQHRHLRWIEEDDSRTFHWHLHACQATLNIKTCLCPLPYSKNTRRFLNYSFN